MAAISPITLTFQAIDQATPAIKNLVGEIKNNLESVTSLTFAYNQVTQSIQQLANEGRQAYDLLIGQNVELQGQLIATQASLAATNKVIFEGFEIKDPTKAIQALTEPVNQAIADLRKGSFDLVGVTSNDLIPLFQAVANDSSKIGASLQDATQLALGFGAATQTLKIPLQQTSNELKLILEGQVSSENRLASALNLNNEIVNRWKAQGVFVDELNKKLATFRAGNALAAQTIDGVTANIKELFLEFGRIAGQPFLQPLVNQLNILYTLIKDNRETIIDIVSGISSFFLEIGTRIQEIATILQPIVEKLGEAIGNELNANLTATENAVRAIADLLVSLVQLTAPLLDLIASIALELSKISNSPFGQILIESGILLGVLNLLQPAIVGLGINLISLISQVVIFGESIGTAYTAIGGFEAVINALALGGIPALQGVIAAAIPELATFGTAATAALAPLLPLIALGSAIALTIELKTIGDLKQGNEELEEYRKQVDAQGEQTLDLARKLKVLADARKANGSLTAEEEAQSKRLQSQQQNQVKSIQEQIASIKELQNLSPEQEATRKIQIEDLENQIKLLQKYSEATKLQAKDLPPLGNEFQQLGNKVAQALEKFNHPATDAEFKQAAKDIVDYTQQQLKAGDITQQQAEARLAKVRDDTRVSLDLQKSADDGIVKSREESLNRLNELAKSSQEKIKAQIDDEVVGNFEGQQKILESKERQLQLEIESTRSAIQKEDALREAQVNTEVDRINKEITASKARLDANPGNTPDDKQRQRTEQANLDRLQSQKNAAQASLNIQSEAGAKLRAQLQQNEGELSSVQAEARKGRRDEELKEFDERQKILDERNATRQISEVEYSRQALENTRARGQAELNQLKEQAGKLGAGNEAARLVIASKEAEIQTKVANAEEKYYQDRSKARLSFVDSEQKELAAKLSEGQVSQQEYNQQSLALTQQRLNAELEEVQRQRGRLKAGDTERATDLAAQEADIRKRQSDAIAQNQEAQVQLIEQSQKRATDAITQSESDRLIQISTLQQQQVIRKVEAEKLQTDATGDRIKAELNLEKDKLAQLQSLPPYSDPQKEEQRQQQIRSSRLQTSQLTKQLIDNEIQQREALYKIVEDRINREIQGVQNAATAQIQALTREQNLQDFLNKSLQNQLTLLQSKKDLVSSTASYYEGELDVLKQTSATDTERQQIAESAALINLKAVQQEAAIQAQITQERQEQKQVALELEAIQLRSEQLQAAANTKKAEAEQAKIEAKPETTPEEKEAARLSTEAAQAQESALQLKQVLLQQQAAINAQEVQQEKDKNTRDSQLQEDQARLKLAQSRVSPFQGQKETEQLRGDILRRQGIQFGGSDYAVDATPEIRRLGENIDFSRISQFIDQARQGQPILTPLTQFTTQPAGYLPTNQQNQSGDRTQNPAQSPKVGTVEITVNNSFASGDNTAPQQIVESIRKELYDFGVFMTR